MQQVWLLFHTEGRVRVCTPQQPLGTAYGLDDTLTAGALLSGFAVPVRAIFDLNAHALFAQTLRALLGA